MDKTQAKQKFHKARDLWGEGKLEEADRILENLARHFPRETGVLYARILCLKGLRNYEAALPLCRKLGDELGDARGLRLEKRIKAKMSAVPGLRPQETPEAAHCATSEVEPPAPALAPAAATATEAKPRVVRRRSRYRRPLPWWAYPAALLALAAFLFGAYRFAGSRAVSRSYQAIRDSNQPLSLAELDAWYAVPEGRPNGAMAYELAFSIYVHPGDELRSLLPIEGDADLPPRGTPVPPQIAMAISEHIRANQAVLSALHKAAQNPDARYDIDLNEGLNILLPHLAKARRAARLLQLETLHAAGRGDAPRAAAACASALALASSLNTEPVMMSQFVHKAILDVGADCIEEMLNRSAPNDEQLARLAKALREADKARPFYYGLIGERCILIDAMDGVLGRGPRAAKEIAKELGMTEIPSDAQTRVHTLFGRRDRDFAFALELIEDTIAATQGPPELVPKIIARLMARLEEAGELPSLLLAHLDAYPQALEAQNRYLARCRNALTAVAIERYRLAENRLPDSLDALVPRYLDGVPQDPFDGQPLRYAKRDSSYVVYSINMDLEDDGGRESETAGHDAYNAGDISFTVNRS